MSCPEPEDWNVADAINALTNMAPLSVTQLRKLRVKIDPTEMENASGSSSKLIIRDLFNDENWGEAWKRFLGKLNVEEVANEDPEHPATLNTDFVQTLQRIAVGRNFRMKD